MFWGNRLRISLKILIVRVVEGFFNDKYNRQNKRVSERCSHIFTFDFCVINALFLHVAALNNVSKVNKKRYDQYFVC
jgi:hypothetical protein